MGNTKKRILKNTVYLYARSILSLILKLYISRLVLLGLGIENFGVYQVVGGLVGMFSFLNSTMASASQRFISYEIGLGEKGNVQKVFSTTLNIHIIFGIIIFLVVEIVGQILLNTKLDLGNVDISTAEWVLHFTALSTVLTIVSVPYNSLLISKEDMKYFAYVDLFGVILQLFVAVSLTCISDHVLIWYAFLMFVVAAIVRISYSFVCSRKYKDVKYKYVWDRALMKRIFSFSGWTTFSAINYIIKTQGVSVILNVFLGPIINAAVGVGNQVNNAIKTFSQNFQMSFMPQIVKTYANVEYVKMNKLITSGAKLSSLLLIALSVPVMLECDAILNLWLTNVPPNASVIVVLILIETIFQSMTCTCNTAIRATGIVKLYEITYNSFDLMSFPCILVWLYYSPAYYAPFIVFIIFIVLSSFIKVWFLKKQIPLFRARYYVNEIFLNVSAITVASVVIPLVLKNMMNENLMRFIIVVMTFELIFMTMVYIFGLNKEEKKLINSTIETIKNKWN